MLRLNLTSRRGKHFNGDVVKSQNSSRLEFRNIKKNKEKEGVTEFWQAALARAKTLSAAEGHPSGLV